MFIYSIYGDMSDSNLRSHNCNVACNCNALFINNLVYADDMVLIASCAGALQTMFNICI